MKNDPLINFCRNVTRLMEEKHLSGIELGKISDVSPAIFSDIAREQANPKFKTMLAIAEGLQVPFSLLIEPENSTTWELYYSLSPVRPKLPRGIEYVPAGTALPAERIEIVKEWAYRPKKAKTKASRFYCRDARHNFVWSRATLCCSHKRQLQHQKDTYRSR